MMGSAPSIVGGQLGRYELHGAIARGGMATVYIGRMTGAAGFSRTVAIKRLHPHLAADSTFLRMFADEARLAARIRHPNVIDTLDVVSEGDELFIVMEFVNGETLARLIRAAATKGISLPAPVVSSIIIGALEGLHSAHDATSECGEPLGIVHRDISPQNILIARDGVPRVLDFGVAKAAGRVQETEGGELKGKLAYMSPEQLTRNAIDRRCDVFAMGIVLWEALTSKRLFAGEDAASTLYAVVNGSIAPPSAIVPSLPPALDAVVLRALDRDPAKRFATAQEMALALEAACPPVPARQTGRLVEELAGETLRIRADIVKSVEGASSSAPIMAIPHADDPSHASGSGSKRITSSARIAGPADAWHQFPSEQSGRSGISGVSSASLEPPQSGIAPRDVRVPTPAAPWVPSPNMSFSPEAETSRPRRLWIAAICCLFATFLIVGLVLTAKALSARSRRAAQPASAAASVVAPTAEPTSAPEPGPSTAPTLTAKREPSSRAVTSAAHPPPRVHPNPNVKQAKSAAPSDCDNPFTVDESGIKRPKPHCFAN